MAQYMGLWVSCTDGDAKKATWTMMEYNYDDELEWCREQGDVNDKGWKPWMTKDGNNKLWVMSANVRERGEY